MTNERDTTTAALVRVLTKAPGQKIHALSATLGLQRPLLNSILYSRRDLFESYGAKPPTWYVRPVRIAIPLDRDPR